MLQNIILKANINKVKSKRWDQYVKTWTSYADFCEKKQINIDNHGVFALQA